MNDLESPPRNDENATWSGDLNNPREYDALVNPEPVIYEQPEGEDWEDEGFPDDAITPFQQIPAFTGGLAFVL